MHVGLSLVWKDTDNPNASCNLHFVICFPAKSKSAVQSAELFGWVLDRDISQDQAMRCAKREPGRSWEALETELNKLGQPSCIAFCLLTDDMCCTGNCAIMLTRKPWLVFCASLFIVP